MEKSKALVRKLSSNMDLYNAYYKLSYTDTKEQIYEAKGLIETKLKKAKIDLNLL